MSKKEKEIKEISKMVYPELLGLPDNFKQSLEIMFKEIGYKTEEKDE